MSLKKLVSQTAIYGLSSILGRFLNYLLVPLHTAVFIPHQFGIITEMYSYVAFLVVLLTYGLETSFFRFINKDQENNKSVFSSAVFSLFVSTTVFISAAIIFSQQIADWLRYPNHNEYVIWFAIIVGLDAFGSIPLAKLRSEGKAKRFAFINMSNVLVNIVLNVFFLGYCMPHFQSGDTNWLIDTFYNPHIGVGYVFISNLIASVVKFGLMLPELWNGRKGFERPMLIKMLGFGWPLLLAGLAGIVNETIDRIMLKRMLFDELGEVATMTQIGIYGACYKVSIIITLFIQAFRYAAEPFFFAQKNESNSKEIYVKVMNYFIIVCSFIFLGVMLYIDLIKYFIPNKSYWEGLQIVPLLLMANVFLGIYYNQSIWYKFINKTIYGAAIAIFGAILTIVINYIFIPYFGYVASAFATLICYVSMTVASYVLGQKFYPINYDLKRGLGYILGATCLYFISLFIKPENKMLLYLFNFIVLMFFIGVVYFLERPKKSIT